MSSNSKNQDTIELVIKGQDEYSDVSEDVREELGDLASEARNTQNKFLDLEKSLDLSDTYQAQQAEVNRLANEQAEAKIKVDKLTKANKEAGGANKQLAAELAKAKAEFAALRTETNKAQRGLQKTKDTARRFGISLKEVGKNQDDMRESLRELAEQLKEVRKRQDELIDTSREQKAAASEQRAELKQQKEETQALEGVVQKLSDAEKAAADQKRKTQEEIARVTAEITQQIEALSKGEIGWEDYKRRVANLGKTSTLTRKELADLNHSIDDQVIAARSASDAIKQQAAQARKTEQSLERYRLELEKLIREYQEGKHDLDQFGDEEERLRRKLKLSEKQVEDLRREMGAYGDSLRDMPRSHDKAAKSTSKFTKIAGRLVGVLAALEAAKLAVDAAMEGNRAYTQNEDALLGVAKTSELAATELDALNAEIKRLSTDVTRLDSTQLLEIAESAGRMGIQGAENILKFTNSINALTSATGMAGDETAEAIAQILNVTGEAQSNVAGVSSAIAELGNTSATTEEQIVHFAKRLASDTATAKLASSEVLGLSAAMAEMGLQAEGSSTVIGRTFRYIEDAVKGGGVAMEELERVTGKTSKQIQNAYGQDKVQLFNDFVAGLGRMQDGGSTLNQILDDMGIKSDENARILGLLSQRHEGLSAAVERSNKAFEEGTAHFEELAKKEASLSSATERLKNRLDGLMTSFGEAFSDDLMRGINGAKEGAEELDETFAELGEIMADIGELGVGVADTLAGLTEPVRVLTGDVNFFGIAAATVHTAIDAVTIALNNMVAGVSELGKQWNKLFGDTEGVEAWAKVQEDALGRLGSSIDRVGNRWEVAFGKSSRAFQDLRDSYNENRTALERMDEGQRNAIETIISQTGYLEGNDSTYRKLTRSIQRAAEEKRILKGLTAEENALIKEEIALLKAQGVSEAEAIKQAKEKAEVKRKAAAAEEEADKKKKQATEQGTDAATGQTEAVKALSGAWKALGVDAEVAAGGITDTGEEIITAFATIAVDAKSSGQQITEAFKGAISKAKTKEEVEALIGMVKTIGFQGRISVQQFQSALQAGNETLNNFGNNAQATLGSLDEAWKTLGIGAYEAVSGITQQGAEIIGAFSTISLSANSTGEQITAAFKGAISKAKTKEEVEALVSILKEAGVNGQLSMEQLEAALSDASVALDGLADSAESAFKSLAGDVALIRGGITEAGEVIIEQFGKVVDSGKYSGEEIRKAFEGAISKARTKEEVEALIGKLEEAGRSGQISGTNISRAMKDARSRLKELKGEAKSAKEELDETGKKGSKALDDVAESAKDAAEEVRSLADETGRAADEADRLADVESSRSVSGGEFGSNEYYALMRNGNTEAATLFKEMAAAYGKTLEGRVLAPDYVEEVVSQELRKLQNDAVKMTHNPAANSSPSQPASQPGVGGAYTVKFDFGGRQVSGQFERNDADALLSELADIAQITR